MAGLIYLERDYKLRHVGHLQKLEKARKLSFQKITGRNAALQYFDFNLVRPILDFCPPEL